MMMNEHQTGSKLLDIFLILEERDINVDTTRDMAS